MDLSAKFAAVFLIRSDDTVEHILRILTLALMFNWHEMDSNATGLGETI